jgi:hypothetical protein
MEGGMPDFESCSSGEVMMIWLAVRLDVILDVILDDVLL